MTCTTNCIKCKLWIFRMIRNVWKLFIFDNFWNNQKYLEPLLKGKLIVIEDFQNIITQTFLVFDSRTMWIWMAWKANEVLNKPKNGLGRDPQDLKQVWRNYILGEHSFLIKPKYLIKPKCLTIKPTIREFWGF